MDKQTVTQLRTSDRVEAPFLVSRKALVSFRNKPGNYLAVTLSDPTGSVPGRLWDNAEQVADQFDVGDVVMVFGRVDEYMGTLQVIIEGVRPCHPGEFSAADFLPSSKRDIGEMRQQLTDLVQRVRQPFLRTGRLGATPRAHWGPAVADCGGGPHPANGLPVPSRAR